MKVGVGSKNKTKVDAVVDLLKDYPMFVGAEVEGVAETVAGAVDRAKQAYVGREYGFGIEGGLIAVPHTKSGYMEVGVCAIFDGTQIHLGLSPAFEWPKKVIEGILHRGLDGSQAVKAAGLTDQDKLGEQGGTIGMLTHGRINRTEQNRLAVMMALVHLENPEHF